MDYYPVLEESFNESMKKIAKDRDAWSQEYEEAFRCLLYSCLLKRLKNPSLIGVEQNYKILRTRWVPQCKHLQK